MSEVAAPKNHTHSGWHSSAAQARSCGDVSRDLNKDPETVQS